MSTTSYLHALAFQIEEGAGETAFEVYIAEYSQDFSKIKAEFVKRSGGRWLRMDEARVRTYRPGALKDFTSGGIHDRNLP